MNTNNLNRTIASFALEGITPSEEFLEYCKLRDAGKITCQEEIEKLKEKYINLGKEN